MFPGNCFSGWSVAIHSRFEHFQLKRWHCKLCFASLMFTFSVGCGIDEWLRTLRSFRLMSTSGSKQVETKQFHPRCADMLQLHWSSLHMLQHVYIHMNMHVKKHMNMHIYKPVTHTHTISSAKTHGVILIGWRGSGSHLDLDGAGVWAYTRCRHVWLTWWCDMIDLFSVSVFPPFCK